MAGGLVAVAFSDVVSSTELWSTLGDARADDVRRRLRTASDEAVAAVGGAVVKDLGDGVMVTFPTASASLEGAVGLQQACASVARAAGIPELRLRVGVSIGEASHEGDDWFGVPVVEAARLCAAAEPGQILVSDSVLLFARRTERVARSLGTRALKGLPDPVPVSEIEWVAPAAGGASLPPILRRHEGDLPFTGRGEAFAQLVSALESSSRQHLVVVSGEPGVGKTRLVSELAAAAAERGVAVLAAAHEEGADSVRRTMARALRPLVDLCQPPPNARDIVAVLGLGDGSPQRAGDVDPASLGDAIAMWLAAAAEQQAVLLVADDLHWASAESLSVLRSLVAALDDSRVLVVGTYRDTDLDRSHPLAAWLADRRRDDPPLRIDLHGLDLYDTVALLAAQVHEPLGEEMLQLAGELHRETEGNAFFLGQVIEHLVDTGALVRGAHGWQMTVALDHIGLPQGVREVVGRRLERLPSGADEVLTVAAVQGREFSVSITRAALGVDLDRVVDAFDAAEASGLVRAEPGSLDRFGFVHALIRQTLLDELSTLRRSRLHLRVAEALDAVSPIPSRAQALRMVDHYLEAAALGGLPRAVDLLPEVWGSDSEDAVYWADEYRAARRALAAADELGLDDTRLARLHILVAGAAWMFESDRDLTRRSFLEAVAIAERVGDPMLFAQAVTVGQNAAGFGLSPEFLALAPRALAMIDQRSEVARELRMAMVQAHSIFAPAGVDPVDEYLELVRDFPDAPFVGAFFALHASSDLEQALQELDRSSSVVALFGVWPLARLDLARAKAHLDQQAPLVERSRTTVLRAAYHQADALLAIARGDLASAGPMIDEVERAAGGEPMFALGAPWQRAVATQWAGEVEAARAKFQELSPLSPYPRLSAANLALFDLAVGDRDTALQRFRESWADGPASLGRDWTYTAMIGTLAELAAGLGLRDEAAELDALLAPFDGQFLLSLCIALTGSVAWLRAGLARCLGDTDEAIRRYERAERFETAQGAVLMAARTRADLASLRAELGTRAP